MMNPGSTSTRRPWRQLAAYRLRRFFQQPEKSIGILLLILLIILVLVPLILIIRQSIVFDTSGPRYVPGAEVGNWTLFYWFRVLASNLSNATLYRPALHSLIVATGMTVVALSGGTLLAWLMVRTDLPFKRFLSVVLIIPYIMPSWTIALAWLVVFKNERYGGAPGLLTAAFGWDPPIWLGYGAVPMIISLGVHYIPYSFILLSGALSSLDSRLEESAEILGANRGRILRIITLPMVLPALGFAFVLTFSKGLGEFGAQAFLGLPVQYYTLSTRVYSAISNRLVGEGSVLVIILIVLTLVTVVFHQYFLGSRKRYTTIGGKGGQRAPMKLGRWRLPVTALVLLFVALFVFGPFLLLAWQSLMRFRGQYGLDNFTLHYWIGGTDAGIADGLAGVFRSPIFMGALKNSVLLAGTTALVTGLAGILTGYIVVKVRGTLLSKAVEGLTFVPYMIPGIAFGGIFLSVFGVPFGPLPALYGSFALLVLTCAVKDLPYASASGTAAMHQIDPALEEAAAVQGAKWTTRFRRIVVPLAKTGFLSAVLLTFIGTMRVLDVIILMVTPSTQTLTSLIFRYQNQGFVQYAYALMIIIAVITVVGHLLIRRLGGKVEL